MKVFTLIHALCVLLYTSQSVSQGDYITLPSNGLSLLTKSLLCYDSILQLYVLQKLVLYSLLYSFVFAAQQPCSLDALIPVLLNENLSPYCDLTLSVKIATGSITVNPGHIIVQPVPLGITVHGEFLIVMEGFAR